MCRATTWMAMHSLLLGNAETTLLFFIHICLDSHGCFLRMDYGLWTENSRGTYNKWDGVARSTIQVLQFTVSSSF